MTILAWLIQEGAFWVFALAAIVGAIAVVVSQNVARMAFWLIVSLGSTAGLFFALNADFVGATQLLIYVGGTLVLLIFGVMLTASAPFLSIKTTPGEGVLAAVVGAMLLSLILYSACAVDWAVVSPRGAGRGVERGYNPVAEGNTTRALGTAFLGARPDRDLGADRRELSPGYLLPFEIVSIHLLVVLIGAAYLARAKRRRDAVEKSAAAI
ncbi:MAG: NADH-quinone oxidoreductase subunit J family protein [Planctomycetaceae bacterium]